MSVFYAVLFFLLCKLELFHKKRKITRCNRKNSKIIMPEETTYTVVIMRDDYGLRLE